MYNSSKFCLLTICAIIFSLNVKSQTIVGFQGGINVSALNGAKDYDENKLRIATSGYGYLDFSLGRYSILSIETGLALSQQGMKHIKIVDNTASRTTTTTINKLDYLIVPVYLRENMTNFYTKIGPYAAYNINAKSTWKSQETQSYRVIKEDSGSNTDFEQNVRPYDVGLSFGMGFVNFFKPGPGRYRGRKKLVPVIQVDFRYNIGLMKIGLDNSVPNMEVRNHTFTLGVSITSIRNK